jgi:hypothetical protein
MAILAMDSPAICIIKPMIHNILNDEADFCNPVNLVNPV